MKKILFLALSACLIVSISYAQSPSTTSTTTRPPGHAALQLTIGGALPVGSFASKDASSASSGLAKFGGLAELAYSLPIDHKNYGFVFGLRGRLNPIDNDPNIAPLKETYSGFNWSANNSSWKAYSAMAGLYVDAPLGSKLDLRFEFGVGAALAYVPASVITGRYDSAGVTRSYVEARVHSKSAVTFSGTAKATFRYHLDKHFQLLAGIDVWYLAPKFKNLTQTAIYAQGLIVPGYLSPSNATQLSWSQYITDYKQTMTTLNFSIGIARSF